MTTRLAFTEKPNAKSSHGWFKEMAVALVAVFALNVSARVSDGMYFDLKCLGDTNGNGRLDLNEAVNAMAVGAAGGGASIYGNPANNPARHELIGFTEETAWRKFYIRASPVRNALRILQSYYLSDDGLSIYAYQDAVVFTNSGATTSCSNGRTLFIRFYWEGKSYPEVSASQQAVIVSDSWNWGNAKGYALSLSQRSDGTFGLQVWVG
ncbi:MAG: hypothetical protein IJV91_10830, partial [Kiritimatiellae bacterium]|nr:hypothetical protein [Kiritimatiellia bacterium]